MVFADHLTRNIVNKESNESTCTGLDMKTQDIDLNASEDRYISIAKETDKDENLVTLKNSIIQGWPEKRDECPIN